MGGTGPSAERLGSGRRRPKPIWGLAVAGAAWATALGTPRHALVSLAYRLLRRWVQRTPSCAESWTSEPLPGDLDENDRTLTIQTQLEEFPMTWTTPAFEDLRLGFEINLYVNNR